MLRSDFNQSLDALQSDLAEMGRLVGGDYPAGRAGPGQPRCGTGAAGH